MNTHREIVERLAAYLLGDLTETQNQAIQRHVAQCPVCQVEVAGLQRVLDLSQARSQQQTDPALLIQARQRLARTLNAEPVAVITLWRKIMTSPITKFVAAAIVLIGVFVMTRYLPARNEQAPEAAVKPTTPPQEANSPRIIPVREPGRRVVSLDRFLQRLQAGESLHALLEAQTPDEQIALVRSLATSPDPAVRAYLAQIVTMKDLPDAVQRVATQALKPKTPDTNEPNQTPTQPPVTDSNRVEARSVSQPMMQLTVVDAETGKRLSGVDCRISMFSLNPTSRRLDLVTDAAGHCEWPYYNQPSTGRIKLYKSGYAIRYVSHDIKAIWSQQQVIKMERGVAIGGLVTTESGNPIANVVVEVLSNSASNSSVYYRYADTPEGKVRTGKDGRWQIKHFPSKATEALIDLSHEDYVSVNRYSTHATLDELTGGTFVSLMRPGLTVAGNVTDQAGEPIAGVTIFSGEYWSGQSAHTTTDALGQFELKHCKLGSLQLLAQAPGYAQGFLELQLSHSAGQADFVLEPESILTVVVTDINEKPIEGVTIRARSWQKTSEGRPAENIRIKEKTNAQGVAILHELPPDTVTYEIYKKGYAQLWDYDMAAAEGEHAITLWPIGRLKGHVYDQQTGELIRHFTCTEGIRWKGQDEPSWQTSNGTQQYSDGTYELALKYHNQAMAVKIIAEGYEPYVSESVFNEGRVIKRDIYLTRGKTITGIVYEPNGTTSRSAYLAIATDYGLTLKNGSLPRNDNLRPVIATDAQGHYRLEPQSGDFNLMVVSDQGFAERSSDELKNEPDIALQPWGRVEGMLFSGNKPLAHGSIVLEYLLKPVDRNPDNPDIRWNYSATTDENGHFLFKRVQPGQVRVHRLIPMTRRSSRYAMYADTEVVGNQTAHVEIGGGGRRVTGHFIRPEGWGAEILEHSQFTILKDIPQAEQEPQTDLTDCPPFAMPQDFFLMTQAQRTAWFQQWSQTPAGKQLMEYMQSHGPSSSPTESTRTPYAVQNEPNQIFVIDDILPGHYRLHVTSHDPKLYNQAGYYNSRVAKCDVAFSVPEPKTVEDYNVVVDLGDIRLETVTMNPELQVGDSLPSMSLVNLQGQAVDLSQLTGKQWLLLDLTTFTSSSMMENTPDIVPDLQQLQTRFAGPGHLRIVSVGEAIANQSSWQPGRCGISWRKRICRGKPCSFRWPA